MNRPSDSARYEALLGGLEITVLPLSEVQIQNRVFRYDSQYFGKSALAAEAQIKKRKWEELQEAADEVESFGAYALTNQFSYVDEGVPFLRCLNIRDGFTNFTDVLCITPEANRLLSKSEVKPGMVLLTMSGSVGNTSVALDNWKYPINSNQDVAKITPKGGTNPYYLAAFLGSKFGQIQMERLPVGSVQQHIFLWMIEKLVISRFSPAFEKAVADAVKSAYELDASCALETEKAEQILLRTLGLEGWQLPEPLTYTRRASETFTVGRLDAERYQEKYYSLVSRLQAYPRGCQTLGEICPVPVNGVEIRDYCEEGIPYLRVGDLKSFDVHLDSVKRVPEIEAEKLIGKVALRKGDVLVSRSGSLAVTGVVEDEWADALISSHLIRVRIGNQDFDPYYVALFLSALPGRMQIEQRTNGGVQPEINQPALKSILLPSLKESDQKQIRACIMRSRETRQQARALLERAKRAVEVAIEENEPAALSLFDTTDEL